MGKELRDIIEISGFPTGKLSLLETEEYAGLLQEFAGEIRIAQIISPEALADTDIAFFACSPEIIEAYAASGVLPGASGRHYCSEEHWRAGPRDG